MRFLEATLSDNAICHIIPEFFLCAFRYISIDFDTFHVAFWLMVPGWFYDTFINWLILSLQLLIGPSWWVPVSINWNSPNYLIVLCTNVVIFCNYGIWHHLVSVLSKANNIGLPGISAPSMSNLVPSSFVRTLCPPPPPSYSLELSQHFVYGICMSVNGTCMVCKNMALHVMIWQYMPCCVPCMLGYGNSIGVYDIGTVKARTLCIKTCNKNTHR